MSENCLYVSWHEYIVIIRTHIWSPESGGGPNEIASPLDIATIAKNYDHRVDGQGQHICNNRVQSPLHSFGRTGKTICIFHTQTYTWLANVDTTTTTTPDGDA